MLIRKRRGWELRESEAAPESVFLNRRALIKAAAAGGILAAGGALIGGLPSGSAGAASSPATPDPTADLYPAKRNERFVLDRAVTPEKDVTTYNNFYEYGTSKDIYEAADEYLKIRPWTVAIDGMVEKPMTVGFDELIRKMPLEERLYRHRCVEAWSIAVPWSGFPMKALVEYAKPLGSAKYVAMQTFMDPKMAPGERAFFYPWPYTEGLTIAEATNELAFMVTGAYGKPLKNANGAPLRLATPWKYGFKSVKSIVKFSFTDQRPKTFWEALQESEYGFWANVNPDVPHPRWSQAMERVIGTGERRPTLIWNGYGEFVASLYVGLEKERLFA
jgi:sulfoxide reductase catalytic subunit YedY